MQATSILLSALWLMQLVTASSSFLGLGDVFWSNSTRNSTALRDGDAKRQGDCAVADSFANAADGHVIPKDWCPGFLGDKPMTITVVKTHEETSVSVNVTSWTFANTTTTSTTLITDTEPSFVWDHTVTVTVPTTFSSFMCPAPLVRKTFFISKPQTQLDASTTAPVPLAATRAAAPLPTWLSGWPRDAVSTACSCLGVKPLPVYTTVDTTWIRTTTTTMSNDDALTVTETSRTHPFSSTHITTWTSIPWTTITFSSCP